MKSNIQDDLQKLLEELNNAYSKSDIKQYCQEHGKTWNYSLITSNLLPGRPLILGFNWGAAHGEKYVAQREIIEADLLHEDLGSLKRIIPYLDKYIGTDFISMSSQSNYCFFRSSKQEEITERDLELCKPIFYKLIGIIKPSKILCFSSKLREHLYTTGAVASSVHKDIHFKRGSLELCYQVRKGKIGSGIDIYFLPHPNYPMKKRAREEAWEFCFNKIADS